MGGLSASEARDTLSDIVSRVAYTGARGLLHRHRANGWPHSHARQNRKPLGARSRVVRKIRGRAGRSHCKAIRPSFERSLRAALAPPAGFADRLTALHEKSSLRYPPIRSVCLRRKRNLTVVVLVSATKTAHGLRSGF